jgi:hypothetical protein
MYCKKCGQTYHDKMNFCVVCGSRLLDKAEENTPEPASEITETAPEELAPEETAPEENAPDEAVSEITPDEPPAPVIAEATPEEAIIEEPIIEETEPESIITENDLENSNIEPAPSELGQIESEVQINEVPARRRVRFYRNPGFAVLSVFIGLLSFALFIGAGASYTVRYLTYPETVSGIVESIDILNLPIGETPVWTGTNRNTTVMDAVYVLSDGIGLTEETIAKLYEQTTFRDDLTDILIGYTEFFRSGEIPQSVTAEDIKSIYTENIDLINSMLESSGGVKLSKEDIALAEYHIEKADDFLSAVSVQNLSEESSIIGFFRALISLPVIIAELAVAVLLIIVIGAVNRNFYPPLRVGGIAALSAAGLFALFLFLIRYQVITIVPIKPVGIVLADISAVISPHLYIFAGILAAVGVLLLIAARILKWVKTR